MTGLRYVGASRALGLQQEVLLSPDDSRPFGLDLGEQISRIANQRQPVPSTYPELTSQGRAEGYVAPGSMCQHPAGTSHQG